MCKAQFTGTDLFVTSYPACLMEFQQTRSRLHSRLRVVDITAIIWNRLIRPGAP